MLATESSEDGISLWLATGKTVLATFGGSGLASIPVSDGAAMIIVADIDGKSIMEAGRAAKAFSELGCQVSIAIPPDGTKDSNQLLVKFGADAVCEMVAAAEPFVNGCDRDAKGDRGHAGDDDDAVPDNEFDAAIKKLAALSPVQYERVRKDEAKARRSGENPRQICGGRKAP